MTCRLPPWPILSLLLLAGSCDRRPAEDAAVFRFINRGDIFTLDLNQMSYGQDFRVTYALREGLYAPTGPDFAPAPADATGVDLSPDHRTYTFHLRPDAKWSNGDPVVAAEYVFSWRLMLASPGEYTYLFYALDGAKAFEDAAKKDKDADFSTVGVEAVDPLTLKVRLAQPVPYFLELVSFPPFYPRNERSMRQFKHSNDAGYDSRYTRPPALVTNGPFMLTSWEFKKGLRLDRNPYYWDVANVKVAAVENVVNDNTLSEVLQFDAKAVDYVAEVPLDIAPDLREKNWAGFKSGTSFGTFFLTLNCQPALPNGQKNPLEDMRVRQALAMSIDKKFVTEYITRLGEKVADSYVPPGTLPGYTVLPGLGHDVEKAKALLAAAGFPDGRGFPKLPILYNSENSTRARIAQVLKQQWKAALGIDVEIEGIEGKIFHERVSSKNYTIATVAWFGDYQDASTFTDKYLSTSLGNDSDWQNPTYDSLLAAAAAESDQPKRYGLLARAEQLINTEAPIIPIYHYVNASLIGPNVGGIEMNPRNLIRWKSLSLAN